MSTSGAAKTSRSNAEYSELLSKLDDVPALPAITIQVNDLIQNPNSTSAQVAELLRLDQSLTAKILKLANSSYYSIPGGVSDVQRALSFLGFNTVAQLVLGISVFSVFKDCDGAAGLSMSEFWKHALATAVCSEVLAKKTGLARPEEAFTCGLLHDIGKLVMQMIDPARLGSVVQLAKQKGIGFFEAEKEWDLPGHCYLGEAIATKWGLPQSIRLTIRYHHTDVTKMSTILGQAKPLISIVRLANTLAVKNQIGHSGDCSKGVVTLDMLAPLKLDANEIEAVEESFKNQMNQAGAFLNAYR